MTYEEWLHHQEILEASLPQTPEMALKRTELTKVETLWAEPAIVLSEIQELLEMALRQYRADVSPVHAMVLVEEIVIIIRQNKNIQKMK